MIPVGIFMDQLNEKIIFDNRAGKWQKCNLVSGMASVASDMGWL